MRIHILLALFLPLTLQGLSQTAPAALPNLPTDPGAVFAAAAPMYDFNDPSLKPWHLKASYQLYDEKGNSTSQGTYEYWWVSPKVYRSTWTRPDATHTDWHTADGKHAHLDNGERLEYFEYKLQSALFSPLPAAADLDPAKVRFDREMKPLLGTVKSPCFMLVPLMPLHAQLQVVPMGLFPTYCFDPTLPVLRVSFSWGALAMEFNQIAKVQGKFLAKDILIFDGPRKILTAKVDTIEGLSPSNSALTPPADVKVANVEKVDIPAGIAVGSLVKKQMPIYPQEAKNAHVSGRVVLQATIGRDGGIHELHVLSAPSPSLAAASLWAVSHWQYKPYLLNGEPVEVETTVNVIFTLGG